MAGGGNVGGGFILDAPGGQKEVVKDVWGGGGLHTPLPPRSISSGAQISCLRGHVLFNQKLVTTIGREG